ncbi:hypothetical protein PCANC_26740 [Puccinia coronata f. sp. avenae]|uniref:Uncharacterized protein n=1 Tax=Puccinia coronata f. sp. avenae TaxID=200324 RepID=A0A2N5RX84_9BASI|nr:hypothetical protein PCANC_26740 [Puccinia coronata f. sp. avenae]PLW40757.1 hypothetical protein PCASD_09313 [Puccinia coronata f. sp. avenae]
MWNSSHLRFQQDLYEMSLVLIAKPQIGSLDVSRRVGSALHPPKSDYVSNSAQGMSKIVGPILERLADIRIRNRPVFTAGALCKNSDIPRTPLSPSRPQINFAAPDTAYDSQISEVPILGQSTIEDANQPY